MKIWVGLFLALFCSQVHAQTSFKCTAHSDRVNIDIKMSIKQQGNDYIIGVFDILSNSEKTGKAHRVVDYDLSRVSEILKCDAYDEECVDRYFGPDKDDEYKKYLHLEVPILHSYVKEIGKTFSFDLEKIHSGRRYFDDKPTKFGASGLSEYFDKEGKLLGRFLYLVSLGEMMECK